MTTEEHKKDLENGTDKNEKDDEVQDDDDDDETREPCCSKERILRMIVFLFISIANKVIAIRMIKKGLHKPDDCPAADAIPQFLLGKIWFYYNYKYQYHRLSKLKLSRKSAHFRLAECLTCVSKCLIHYA